MGLVLSVFSLLGNVKEVAQWYRNINGNLFTYWQLARKQKNGQFSNKRFKLHDLSKTNDPRHLALIPFEEEWQLECPSKNRPENIFLYGANTNGQVLILQINWRPVIEKNLVEATAKLTLKEADSILTAVHVATLPLGDLLDNEGHISSFRIGAILLQISRPFGRMRVCYRGFLTNTQTGQVQFARLNFLWACLCGVHDFANDYNASFMMHQFAAQGHAQLERENRFEQWGQVKGKIKLEDEESRDIFLWGVKAKYEPLEEGTKCTRLWAYNTKGVGFHLGSVEKKTISYDYGYVNIGNGLIRAVSNVDFNDTKQAMANIDSLAQLECTLTVEMQEKSYHSKGEGPFEKISDNIWLCPMTVNSHKAMGFYFKEETIKKSESYSKPLAPTGKLKAGKPETVSRKIVLKISHPEAICRNLTGGKGSSLGELMQMNAHSAIQFTVPNGVIVTTVAYELFIQENTHLLNLLGNFESATRNLDTVSIKQESERLMAQVEKSSLPANITEELETQLFQMFGSQLAAGKMFAVRSSAVSEDSEEMSAAGQMSTFLGVRTLADIRLSIVKCWASQFSQTAIEYKRGYGQPLNSPMAVVVQEMIHCQQAGVIFTCDPVTGNERYLTLTANYGLGESVVSSLSDPDTITVEVDIQPTTNIADGCQARQMKGVKEVKIGAKTTAIQVNAQTNSVEEESVPMEQRAKCCLDEQQISTLSNLALTIHHHHGDVRDIEWGFRDGTLYLLQSRPVTNLNSLTEWEIMHEMDTGQNSEKEILSRANLGEVFPGASSYICLSWVFPTWNAISHETWKNIRNADEKSFTPYYNQGFGVAFNSVFFNLKSICAGFAGDTDSLFMKGMQLSIFGHTFKKEILQDSKERIVAPKSSSLLSKLIAGYRFACFVLGAASRNRERQQQFSQFQLTVDPGRATSVDLFHVLGHQMDRSVLPYSNHLCVTVVSSLYNAILYSFLRANSHTDDENKCLDAISQIVSSAQNVISAQVPHRLSGIARTITEKAYFFALDDAGAENYLRTCQEEAGRRYRDFLLEFGHRGYKEFDPYAHQWEDNAATLVQSLKAMISKESEHLDNKVTTDSAAERSVIGDELPLFKRLLLQYVFVPLSQHGIRIREEGKNLLIRTMHQYRKVFWLLADRLVEEGKIPDRELLFFMTFYELSRLVSKPNASIVSTAKLRARYQQKKERLIFSETTYGPDIQPRNYEPTLKSKEFSGNCRLKGVPVSSGKVIARCCVAFSLEDAKNLQKGDILVTYSTDIGWSPYFVILSGLVTAIGGLISHGAVIAREYGLPCLVGVEDAMQAFQSGDIVFLDSENGEIVKLEQ